MSFSHEVLVLVFYFQFCDIICCLLKLLVKLSGYLLEFDIVSKISCSMFPLSVTACAMFLVEVQIFELCSV